ncbi:MAG: 2-hydroxyacyl-CoA dehydratase, partial [Oscillospiraceae bacterium]|nr:2-hydroxyacyl-CoA dehydratase [Oscillospiraceae bacterium]
WGGLPKPSLIIAGGDFQNNVKIGELMAKEFGTKVYFPTGTTATEVDPDQPWWDIATDHWDLIVQDKRLDRAEEEIWNIIRFLEQETGRKLDMNKLIQAINWGVEQNMWFKKARDLIARTIPAPVAIADVVGAVMQTQWHKGTEWAVGHAKAFYEEIKERVDNGVSAIKNERIRLMWIGRGLWFNLAFYQYFEEKYGAAFIWSMYLAMASDTHPRKIIGDDPVRALAAYESMNILHTPPWNNNWYLHEAITNHIDGVVYLVPENCMNNGDFAYFISKRLEDGGFPVCVLRADPADDKKWDQEAMTAAVEDLILNRILPMKVKEKKAQAE